MGCDNTAFAHMLKVKDYSVFSFVPRLMFWNLTKGWLCKLELFFFDVVVQT